MTSQEVLLLLNAAENERLECKRFQNGGDFDELCKYVAGIANAGGGVIVLGVSDARPRVIVGTPAFAEPGKTTGSIFQRLLHSVSIEEHTLDGKRVVVVSIPPRLPGIAVSDKGRYWYRVGEELVPMSDAVHRGIHQEAEVDFSAQELDGTTIDDLDPAMLTEFRGRIARRSPGGRLPAPEDKDMLRDAELVATDGRLTVAAVLLLGRAEAISRLMPQAEIIYEYRSAESAGPAQDRRELRQPLLAALPELWNLVNLRNDRQSIQEGLFRRDILTFDEAVIREAILNAVAHRSYRDQPSAFIRQYARRLEVESPGGFPRGVTIQNLLSQQHPRNRRLAEALSRVGLVERAGQGVNLMYERSVQQGKRTPNYTQSDASAVRLVLDGTVSNPLLVAALERVGAEQLVLFRTEDYIVLDCLQRGEPVPPEFGARLPELRERGLVESIGRGRGVRYFISQRLSTVIGQPGAYTRRRGLDRSESEALLLTHLRGKGTAGAAMGELEQVLPSRSRAQVLQMLTRLSASGVVRLRGSRRWARWVAAELSEASLPDNELP